MIYITDKLDLDKLSNILPIEMGIEELKIEEVRFIVKNRQYKLNISRDNRELIRVKLGIYLDPRFSGEINPDPRDRNAIIYFDKERLKFYFIGIAYFIDYDIQKFHKGILNLMAIFENGQEFIEAAVESYYPKPEPEEEFIDECPFYFDTLRDRLKAYLWVLQNFFPRKGEEIIDIIKLYIHRNVELQVRVEIKNDFINKRLWKYFLDLFKEEYRKEGKKYILESYRIRLEVIFK